MNLVTNISFLVAFAAMIVVSSIVGSIACHDWTWFSRSGSILTLCGAALVTRKLLRLGIDQFIEDENTIDGGDAFNGLPSSKYVEGEREQKRDVIGATIGFWFILIGTFIWGYGDLVNRVF